MRPLSPMTVVASKRLATLLLILGLSFGAQAGAVTVVADPQESVSIRNLLSGMVRAVHSLNYEGTLVYLLYNRLETLQITHTVNDQGERERLISLNGVPKQVIRDNASVICINPATRSVSVGNRLLGKGFQAMLALDVDQLSDYYDFTLAGSERIVDRQARVVLIKPRDDYRYGYRLFVDEKTRLPLKTEMLNPKGQSISQIMFTALRVDDALRDALNGLKVEQEDYQWNQPEQRPSRENSERSDWRFSELPPGFTITLRISGSLGKQQKVEHLVLSDGLASVSVYLEHIAGLQGGARMGSINAFGKQKNGLQITAIGEVPEKTVIFLVDALQAGEQESGKEKETK